MLLRGNHAINEFAPVSYRLIAAGELNDGEMNSLSAGIDG
jgi:hypothetical protein